MLRIIILFFGLSIFNDTPDFVSEFHNVNSKQDEANFIKKYSKSSDINIVGYVISLKMKQAKYKFFPWEKLSIFNKEKNNLEKLIKANPKNLHLRYLRLVIQENTPKLLNYFSSIENDKFVINKFLTKKDKTDYLDQYIKNNTSL
jgi:hypothetical protein